MSQMSSADNVSKVDTDEQLNTPLDGLILWVARLVGGSKAKEVERFLKFAVVGTIGAMIDLGVSNLLMATLLSPEASAGDTNVINVGIASTISFIAAVSSNFFWNRYWTYPDSRSRPVQQQLVQFFVVSTIGWVARIIWIAIATAPISALVVRLLSDVDISNRVVLQLGATLAILVGIFVVMIWNFFVNRYWTYGDVD